MGRGRALHIPRILKYFRSNYPKDIESAWSDEFSISFCCQLDVSLLQNSANKLSNVKLRGISKNKLQGVLTLKHAIDQIKVKYSIKYQVCRRIFGDLTFLRLRASTGSLSVRLVLSIMLTQPKAFYLQTCLVWL